MSEPQGRRFGGYRRAAHVLGGRVRQDAIQDAGPVEPGRDREPPRHGGRPEPADLLHPPDVQLQVRAPRGQRGQAPLGTPRQVAAQVRFGVFARAALEAGQVCSYCESQPVGERRQRMRGHGGQVGEVQHALTLRQFPIGMKLTRPCVRRSCEPATGLRQATGGRGGNSAIFWAGIAHVWVFGECPASQAVLDFYRAQVAGISC